MKVHFVGDSFAPKHLAEAAQKRGFALSDLYSADLVFLSLDTPTDSRGQRDLAPIHAMIDSVKDAVHVPLVLTSQVTPGFTRALNMPTRVWHVAETLRIKDAAERAYSPEQWIVGMADISQELPVELLYYLRVFKCPILKMSYEEAEFAKMAINAFLAAQVDMTNHLSGLAEKCGASWAPIAAALRNDKRIGPHAYLSQGRWQDSLHLLRDMVTLDEIAKR